MSRTDKHNLLLVGAGGREFALARKLVASPLCAKLFVAPLRDGFLGLDKVANESPEDLKHETLLAFAKAQKISLVVIGGEQPLVEGLSNKLRAAGLLVFGPDAKGAELEGSKIAMKQAVAEAGIPTAAWVSADTPEQALAFLAEKGAPLVIKTDGLAAGKGVVIAETTSQAEHAIRAAMCQGQFGNAGARLVLEEQLIGEELSFFALLDGKGGVVPFGSVRDWKRVGVGDTGLNTGGMGSLSPAPNCSAQEEAEIMKTFIRPIDRHLRQEGADYRGVLFAGLMRTSQGLRLLEYNVRFGDPETQSLLPRLKSDLLPLLLACAEGCLDKLTEDELPQWDDRLCLSPVLAARGYPQNYATGSTIDGLENLLKKRNGVAVVHAGTKYDSSTGSWLADGGRVLALSALAGSLQDAQAKLRRAVHQIKWDEGFYRQDLLGEE